MKILLLIIIFMFCFCSFWYIFTENINWKIGTIKMIIVMNICFGIFYNWWTFHCSEPHCALQCIASRMVGLQQKWGFFTVVLWINRKHRINIDQFRTPESSISWVSTYHSNTSGRHWRAAICRKLSNCSTTQVTSHQTV